MKTDKFMKTGRSLAWFLIGTMMLVVPSGCALQPKTPTPRSPARQHVDTKAQQQYYDLGVQQYSRENYGEAKKAFEQVLELGPSTALGVKAQENLKKIQRILKTLEEIEAK